METRFKKNWKRKRGINKKKMSDNKTVFKWVMIDKNSKMKDMSNAKVCRYTHGESKYMTCAEMRAYIDGAMYCKGWTADWMFVNESVWAKPEKIVEHDNGLDTMSHIILYDTEKFVFTIDGVVVKRNPNRRYKCIQRTMTLNSNVQMTNDFLIDVENENMAQNYIDNIFELHEYRGWKTEWFYSYKEVGWLKFKIGSNEQNEKDIEKLDHFFLKYDEDSYNESTGHKRL